MTVLAFAQAQAKAREWFENTKRSGHGVSLEDYTVADAITDYLDAYSKDGKGLKITQSAIDTHILPRLGTARIQQLTKRKIESWHRAIAESPPRVRTRTGDKQRYRDTSGDPDASRRRKSTANRILTILKAALNHAAREYPGISDDAWRRVRPFKGADAARIRYLSDDESRRLINACEGEFRTLATAALMTGCRYGELTNLRVSDYDPDAGTVLIRESKSGGSRHVFLTDEGTNLIASAAAGKAGNDLLLPKADGCAWGKSHQKRPLELACQRARINPKISFHGLRHTYASRLVMQGADLMVVAKQLGHSDTRMVERHYGHLAPSYVAMSVRAAFSELGLEQRSQVIPISTNRMPA